MKQFSWLDQVIMELDTALRTILPPVNRSITRPFPGEGLSYGNLSVTEKKHVVGLMRVNHSGEVCAQALYQGQALSTSSPKLQAQLRKAAAEEVEHLAWCERCLSDLGGRVSLLNPLWYSASLFLGAMAGLLGDRISLGFVAEIERQVEAHLASHLRDLAPANLCAKAVLEQMKADEAGHAHSAIQAGGVIFPKVIQHLMQLTSKCMTKTSYYV